jgi:EmrB/QacA subfamily drug resistance transporter
MLIENPAPAEKERTAAANRRALVFASALATIFMGAVEATIVATAMPAIVHSLGDFGLFSWTFGAYLLAQAVTIPIYGRLADVYGRKAVLLVGIAVFLAGSALCALAWSMVALIAFRVVQGIGAGSLIPIAQTIVGDIYSGRQRARMQGYISSTFGSAAILGPLLGGVLADHLGWPAVFWINLPLGLLAAVMLQFALEENVETRRHRIDTLGAVLMLATIGLLMFALIHAQSLGGGAVSGALAACVVLFALLWAHERRTAEPMLPFALYRIRVLAGGNAASLGLGAIMMTIVGFLPAYMQAVMGASALTAGAALGAMSLAWPVGGFIGSRILLGFSYRRAAAIGAGILAAGSAAMTAVAPDAPAALPIGAALVIGFGMGVTNICFMVGIQASVDWNQRGAATSSLMFSRLLGQSLGSAVFGGIVNLALSARGLGGDVVARVLQSGGRLDGAATNVAPILDALTGSIRGIFLLGSLLALGVLASVLTLPSNLTLAEHKPAP